MTALTRRKKQVLLAAFLFIGALSAFLYWMLRPDTINIAVHQQLQPVKAFGPTRNSYDVIVAGTDPEGLTAAISAARNGLNVLLVDGRNREILGGVMTLGWLNSLDNNYSPKQQPLSGKHNFLNKGLFQEWYDQIEGTSFDVNTAANAFNKMVSSEPNIDVMLKAREMAPVVEGSRITGLRVMKADGTTMTIGAKVLIDATQDADMAAAAGVPYTYGREDLGDRNAQMAVTLVFKMSGVTQEIWDSFAQHQKSGIDKMSAWGFPSAKNYVSSNPERVKLRGLNIGRQNDDTILINAMHIYKVDPLNPASVEEGLAIGRKEAPLIAAYLKKTFKEFKDLEFAGTAPELYVRETRHIQAEYRLKMADVMENRDAWDAVAYGSYKVDIQSMNPNDPGAIALKPQVYGIPFRCIIPLYVDGMLVVGRSAGFDSLPHGSARVVPLGMATGQAAGTAAKLVLEKGISFRELSRSAPLVAELRNRLTAQGVDLMVPEFKKPAYALHPEYSGLLAAASMSLTYGGDHNRNFDLDGSSNALRFSNGVSGMKKGHASKFTGNAKQAVAMLTGPENQPLTLDQAAYTIALAAGLQAKPDTALGQLMQKGWIKETTLNLFKDRNRLTNGDSFMLIRDVLENYAGVKYE